MLKYDAGNILESGSEAILIHVNCSGVMSSGILLQLKRAYPENYRAYALACLKKEVNLGSSLIFDTGALVFPFPRFIINFPVKKHWSTPGEISFIKEGMIDFTKKINKHGIKSVAIPNTSCADGESFWNEFESQVGMTFSASGDTEITIINQAVIR